MMKLLSTADGKIPVLQIIIGIILGAISTFFYIKFARPKIIFENAGIVETTRQQKNVKPKNTLKNGRIPPVNIVVASAEPTPPPQAIIHELEEVYPEDSTSDESDEEDEDDEDDEILRQQQQHLGSIVI